MTLKEVLDQIWNDGPIVNPFRLVGWCYKHDGEEGNWYISPIIRKKKKKDV